MTTITMGGMMWKKGGVNVEPEYIYKVVDYVNGKMRYAPVIVRCDELGETIVYIGSWSETREDAQARVEMLREARDYER